MLGLKLFVHIFFQVRIPDCAGPERILEIISKDWDSAYDCLEAAIPYLYECPDGMDTGDPREMR